MLSHESIINHRGGALAGVEPATCFSLAGVVPITCSHHLHRVRAMIQDFSNFQFTAYVVQYL